MIRADLKDIFANLTTARGFTKESGFQLREFEEGFVALEVKPQEKLVQFMGYVHAGVITGLADHAAGAAYASVLPEGKLCLTIELKINFMQPPEGDLLVAEAKVISLGKSVGVVESHVYAETGRERKMIAAALVTLKSISP